MVAWRVLLFVAVLLALGTLIVVRDRKLRARRSIWPTCTGIIVDAKVTTERVFNPQGASGSFTVLRLKYSYVVNGLTYQGQGSSDSKENRPYLLKVYGPGAPVEISYDPANPNVSEIADPDLQQGTIRLIAMLVIVGLIAFIFAIVSGVFI